MATIDWTWVSIVESIESNVRRKFTTGDRICSFFHGGCEVQLDGGASGEYPVAKGDIAIKIPAFLVLG